MNITNAVKKKKYPKVENRKLLKTAFASQLVYEHIPHCNIPKEFML